MKKILKKWYHTEERKNIMKKIIGIIFISLMFCNIGFAEIRLIEEKLLLNPSDNDTHISTYCIDGYKFVEYRLWRTPTGNMVQFFENKYGDGKLLPAKC